MSGGLPAETVPGRVCLRVNDPTRVAEFYRDVVGLEVLERTGGAVRLGADGAALLVLRAAPELSDRDEAEAGLFHTAFRVSDRAALGAALERIERDWRLTGASDHRVSEALYLRDPEGNGVELYRDRPRDEWPTRGGRVEMDTLALDLDALRAAGQRPGGVDAVGHVHLEVTDLEAARRFYADRVGLGVRQALEGALFLAAGDYHHHVGLNTWNGRSRPAAGRGIDWFELLVPDGDALAAARERLECERTDEGLAVTDPDGIGLRIRVAPDRARPDP